MDIKEIEQRIGPGCIVDVGCNDGVLLNQLNTDKFYPVGIDPSDVSRDASIKSSFYLVNDFLKLSFPRTILVLFKQFFLPKRNFY